MLLLEGDDSDVLELVTGSAADVEVHASWSDWDAGVITYGRTNTASITTATTTTVVGAPGAIAVRNVRHLNARNNHGSNSTLVTFRHAAPNSNTLFSCTLLAGEAVTLDESGRWCHFDALGHPYAKQFQPQATQAELEAGSNLLTTVSPATLQLHPAAAKFWCFGLGSGLQHTPFLGTNFNLSSVTDTAAGRCTFNIATDFSSVNWACAATVERTSTTMTVTNLKFATIRNGTQAAGSVEIEVFDGTATTAVQEDPQRYHVAGYGDQ